MELITVDHLAGLLSLAQENDGKKTMLQSLQLVSLAKTDAETLVNDYLSHQGPPFSDHTFSPTLQMDGIPVLDEATLPSSPWKRLSMGLSSFLSFRGWFASVLTWQKSLNPKSKELLNLLEISRKHTLAISSNLASLLGQHDIPAPTSPYVSPSFKQKVAGYLVCKNYYDWLVQTERDLIIVVAESAV
ncbi:cardiotrophin-2-like [Pyxicephalus adspersus]|uniref:Ciliary neurotrophic factor n=1 Tax=Pyxicephalus adspersus TaxID=30357 RepID=A0AAV3AAY1_PYXAD|nr:TPA: hypothetical protein GDO54_014898 [Pyxicephalus adspersus]